MRFMRCSEKEVFNPYGGKFACKLRGSSCDDFVWHWIFKPLLQKNLIKKIIGLNIMDTATYLFLAEKGYIAGRIAPIVVDNVTSVEAYINPVPSGLVLTGIVVSVSVTALMLSLTIRLYRKYHTLDMDEISTMLKKEDE